MAIITNLQPPAGEPIASDTVLQFDVIDPVIEELRIFVWVVFAETGQVELARDGANFQPLYSFSQVGSIPGGRRFSIRRVGGWPSTPELRVDDCACPPELAAPTTGEVNTASNQGAGPGSLFITKVAEDLQFRTLRSSDGSITITTEPDTVDLVAASGAGDWNAVLTAGNTSGGVNALMSDEDEIEWNPDPAPGPGGPLLRGWKTARRGSFADTGGATEDIGGPLVLPGQLEENGDYVILRLQGFRREQAGAVLSSLRYAVIERVYNIGPGGVLTIDRTVTYENEDDWLDVVYVTGPGGGLQLQCVGGDESTVEAYVKAEVIIGRAPPQA